MGSSPYSTDCGTSWLVLLLALVLVVGQRTQRPRCRCLPQRMVRLPQSSVHQLVLSCGHGDGNGDGVSIDGGCAEMTATVCNSISISPAFRHFYRTSHQWQRRASLAPPPPPPLQRARSSFGGEMCTMWGGHLEFGKRSCVPSVASWSLRAPFGREKADVFLAILPPVHWGSGGGRVCILSRTGKHPTNHPGRAQNKNHLVQAFPSDARQDAPPPQPQPPPKTMIPPS
eukprot:gene19188-biopygen12999